MKIHVRISKHFYQQQLINKNYCSCRTTIYDLLIYQQQIFTTRMHQLFWLQKNSNTLRSHLITSEHWNRNCFSTENVVNYRKSFAVNFDKNKHQHTSQQTETDSHISSHHSKYQCPIFPRFRLRLRWRISYKRWKEIQEQNTSNDYLCHKENLSIHSLDAAYCIIDNRLWGYRGATHASSTR